MSLKININGVSRDMTPEEEKIYQEEFSKLPEPQPSPEQRISELESQLAAMSAAYSEGVNEA